MDALLDLVCIAQDSELMTSDRHTSLEPARYYQFLFPRANETLCFVSCRSGLTKLAEQMRRDRRLMNGLANQENVTDMLSSTCQLFPPDLMRLCHQQFDQALTSSGIAPREKSRGRCCIDDLLCHISLLALNTFVCLQNETARPDQVRGTG